jgi:hypothetical protein
VATVEMGVAKERNRCFVFGGMQQGNLSLQNQKWKWRGFVLL